VPPPTKPSSLTKMASSKCIQNIHELFIQNKNQYKEEVLEENLIHFSEYRWTMFDGESLSSNVKDAFNEPIQPEYLNDVITHGYATLIWDDAYGQQIAHLRAPEITFKYIINSIIYRYNRYHKTPSKVCILEGIQYNPFEHIIRIVFGS